METSWIVEILPNVGKGLLVTLKLSAVLILGSILLGTVIGVGWSAASRLLAIPIKLYVELWRGLPMIVTIFLIFFGLPVTGMKVDEFWAAGVALILWGSANIAEIVRGSIAGLPAGQDRAGEALGLPRRHRLLSILLPQALKRSIAPSIGIVLILIQSTTLASLVGLREVVQVSRGQMERMALFGGESHGLAIFVGLMIIFFLVCYPLSQMAKRYERRMS